jgi:hypothetical protein
LGEDAEYGGLTARGTGLEGACLFGWDCGLGYVTALLGGAVRQEPACSFEMRLGHARGVESVVSDLAESAGQDVEQEPADELDAVEREGAALGLEGDVGVGDLRDAAVGDRDSLDVAREVLGEVAHRPALGRFDVDDPVAMMVGELPHCGVEGAGRFDIVVAPQVKLAAVEGSDEAIEEASSEHHAQLASWEEVVRLGRHPAGAVEMEPSAGDHAVQMRVVGQLRGPRVEHGGDTQTSTEILAGEVPEDGRGGLEEQPVDFLLVVVRDRAELVRQGEHHLEVRRGQHPLLACLEPLGRGVPLALRAVAVPAAVVCGGLPAAGLTGAQVHPQRGRAARAQKGDNAPMRRGEPIKLSVSVTMAPERLGDQRGRDLGPDPTVWGYGRHRRYTISSGDGVPRMSSGRTCV